MEFNNQTANLIEILKVNNEEIELYIPIGNNEESEEHAWNSTIKFVVKKDDAVKAGFPQKIFELDTIHYEEYTGKKLIDLLKLVECDKSIHFSFKFKI